MQEGDKFVLPQTLPADFVKKHIGSECKGYTKADKHGGEYFTVPSYTIDEAEDDLEQVKNTRRILKLADDTIEKIRGGPSKRQSFEAALAKHQKTYDPGEVDELLEKISDLESAVAILNAQKDREYAKRVATEKRISKDKQCREFLEGAHTGITRLSITSDVWHKVLY